MNRPLAFWFVMSYLAHHQVTARPPIIHPSNLQTITLQRGRLTTAYRAEPVPQLKCIRGACHLPVYSVQCTNRGFDGRDIQWQCSTGDLPPGCILEVVTVNCEGYPHPESVDIVVGSCGLVYGVGIKGGHHGGGHHHHDHNPGWYNPGYYGDSGGSTDLGMVLLIIIIGLACICLCIGGGFLFFSSSSGGNFGGGGAFRNQPYYSPGGMTTI